MQNTVSIIAAHIKALYVIMINSHSIAGWRVGGLHKHLQLLQRPCKPLLNEASDLYSLQAGSQWSGQSRDKLYSSLLACNK